jgi:hypothetical protein
MLRNSWLAGKPEISQERPSSDESSLLQFSLAFDWIRAIGPLLSLLSPEHWKIRGAKGKTCGGVETKPRHS